MRRASAEAVRDESGKSPSVTSSAPVEINEFPLASSHTMRCISRLLLIRADNRCRNRSPERYPAAISVPAKRKFSSVRLNWKRIVCSTHSVSAINCSCRSFASIRWTCNGSHSNVDKNKSIRHTGSSHRHAGLRLGSRLKIEVNRVVFMTASVADRAPVSAVGELWLTTLVAVSSMVTILIKTKHLVLPFNRRYP